MRAWASRRLIGIGCQPCQAPRKRAAYRRDMGRESDRSYAGILAFELDVDPFAADTSVRINMSQHNGMSCFVVEVVQHSAGTDSTCRSTGLYGHFEYLTERAEGLSRHFSCLIPTCVRHHDDPQRVSPTTIAVGRKYAEDTLGHSIGLVSRWYDDADSLDFREDMRWSHDLHQDVESQKARQLFVKNRRRRISFSV
jgi:hypothetical protein